MQQSHSGEADFFIPKGQTLRLRCEHLDIGLKEVLFWDYSENELFEWQDDEINLWTRCCIWEDGHISTSSKKFRKESFLWIPKPPKISFRIKVLRTDEGIEINIITETDQNKINEF